MRARRVRRLLWILAVCVLGVLGLRAFVGDVFRITSSSMVPYVRPGEVVLVAYDDSEPSRMEPVVVERGGEYVFKRAAGIGDRDGESIRITPFGDLKIDGEYLPPEVPRHRVLLFDQERHDVADHFARGSTQGDPWIVREDGALRLDAREIDRGHEAGLLRYHPRLLDHHLDREGNLVGGTFSVHDAAVEFEVRALEAGGVLRVALREEGDTFWLAVELNPDCPRMSILRDDQWELTTLIESECDVRVGAWNRVEFANVDNHLSARFGATRLTAGYEHNTPAAGVRPPGTTIGQRVKLGGESCQLELRGLRLYRDLHYSARGEYAVGTPFSIEPGKVFLLGDNSSKSRDSREYGPVDLTRVVGRAVMVVWPPSAVRWLE